MELSLDIESYGLAFSDDDPVGDDPKYLDEFDLIKTEIEKISGCNFALVETHAKYILLEKSKDLRVAGYLLLALTYLKGLSGLIEGLSIYNEMLASFGATMHPIRPIAKLSTIKWLNTPKIEAFIKKFPLPDDKNIITIKALVQRLNELIEKTFPEIENRFFILNHWLSSLSIAKEKVNENSALLIKNTVSIPPKKTSFIIEDRKTYEEICKNLLVYYKKDNQRSEQISLSRILRWPNSLKVPTSEHHKTLLSPMRKEGMNEIAQLQKGNDWILLFNQIESAFLETSGHYCLDLQYYSYCALNALSDHCAIEHLTFHLKRLLKNNAGIINLLFNDGTPFASETTKDWLMRLTTPPLTVRAREDNKKNTLKTHFDFIHQAKQLSEYPTLSAEVLALKALPTTTERESVEKSFAIAQLLSVSQKELACFHYQDLIEHIKKHQLALWLPELAIEILSAYKTLLLNLNASNEEIKPIIKWLCQLAPTTCF